MRILKVMRGPDKPDSGYISYASCASNLGGDPTKQIYRVSVYNIER